MRRRNPAQIHRLVVQDDKPGRRLVLEKDGFNYLLEVRRPTSGSRKVFFTFEKWTPPVDFKKRPLGEIHGNLDLRTGEIEWERKHIPERPPGFLEQEGDVFDRMMAWLNDPSLHSDPGPRGYTVYDVEW